MRERGDEVPFDAADPPADAEVATPRNGRGQTEVLHLFSDCRGLENVPEVRWVERGLLFADIPVCQICLAHERGEQPMNNGGGSHEYYNALRAAAKRRQEGEA